MKTNILIGLCALLSLASLTATAHTEEVKQVITRQFTVSDPATLSVNNSFGNLVIAQGNASVIDFRIEITGTGKDQKTAQRMVDRVSVSLTQSGNTVTAHTTLASTNQNCNNCGISVNYLVLVPPSVYLDLTNKYGNVNVNTDAKLDFRANVQYGNLTTRNLLGSNNNATVKYGNLSISALSGSNQNIWVKYGNIDLGEATSLTIDCEYGKTKIAAANSVNMTVSFGGLTASRIDNLALSTRYSDITVENLGSLSGSSEYSKFEIANLASRFELSSIKYGGVRIGQCSPRLESIRIRASYCNVSVGLSPQGLAQANLNTRYGNINLPANGVSSAVKEGSDRFSKSFSGTIGQGSTRAEIEISNSYANISLR